MGNTAVWQELSHTNHDRKGRSVADAPQWVSASTELTAEGGKYGNAATCEARKRHTQICGCNCVFVHHIDMRLRHRTLVLWLCTMPPFRARVSYVLEVGFIK